MRVRGGLGLLEQVELVVWPLPGWHHAAGKTEEKVLGCQVAALLRSKRAAFATLRPDVSGPGREGGCTSRGHSLQSSHFREAAMRHTFVRVVHGWKLGS